MKASKKKKNNTSSDNIDINSVENKANAILDNLGTLENEYSVDIDENGAYIIKKQYSNYGISIESSSYPYDYLTIHFSDQTVYDSRNGIYIPGKWEKVLDVVHENIPLIIHNIKEKERLLKHKRSIVRILRTMPLSEGTTVINDSLKISVHYLRAGSYDEYCIGVYYKIEENGIVVFWVYDARMFGDSEYMEYIPGEWENVIQEYKEYAEIRNSRSIEKIRKR